MFLQSVPQVFVDGLEATGIEGIHVLPVGVSSGISCMLFIPARVFDAGQELMRDMGEYLCGESRNTGFVKPCQVKFRVKSF